MTEEHVNRRDFFKLAGLAGLALPAYRVVGHVGDNELVESPEEYGGFLVRRRANGDGPYEVDDSVYQRWDQKNETFSRLIWDQEVIDGEAPYASVAAEHIMNNDEGFTRLDYAFYTASWTVATTLGSGAGAVGGSNNGLYSWEPLGGFVGRAHLYDLPPWEAPDWTPQEVSNNVKKAALFYGASLAGIAELDERWIYSHRYTKGYSDPPNQHAPILFDDVDRPQQLDDWTLVIPNSMKYVISLAFEMDYDAMATYISGPGSAATGNGYSRMSFTAACVAEFIRGLGYQAIPCGNCTGLSIPIALDAGLGELGRNGLLITPKYGPRVRLAKVFTNMPLVPDNPISFGVTEFCEVCGKCADLCPNEAIVRGERTFGVNSEKTNNPGVLKWPVDGVKCHLTWAQSGTDCSVCIRVCPFNKPEGWLHDVTRALISSNSGLVDKAMLKMDNLTYGDDQANPREYWKKDNFIHIKK